MLDSRAADTACKYSNGWQRGKTRAQSKVGVPVLPPVPLQVALYLAELVERAVIEGHFAYAKKIAHVAVIRPKPSLTFSLSMYGLANYTLHEIV